MSARTASWSRRPGTRRSAPSPPSSRAWTASKIAAIVGDQCDAEAMVALKDLMAALGSPQRRLPPGRRASSRPARAAATLQCRHPRHRPGRCDPAGRQQPALGIAGAERPHPQALPRGQAARSRASAAPVDLTYPVEQPRRRCRDACATSPTASGSFAEKLQGREEPAGHRRHGRARPRGRRGGAGAGAQPRRAACATTGTASPCCTPRRAASAASISAWCRARAAATSPASWPARRASEIEAVYLLGGRRDRHRASSARPS